ncbi:MIP/aquaporin family protein [Weissella paramesenteroides]|uniref:MIP/aquaporin family protein n=1 Tax=Weissella paramesenteroides TaxID=1249 RepID=UPI003F204308
MKKKIFGEVFGTALLVFFGPALVVMGGYNDLLGPSIGWGVSLAVLVYAFGPLSGAHFNPAVTLMMFLTKQMKAAEAVIYVIAQLVGGLIGGLFLTLTYKAYLKGAGLSWSTEVAKNNLNGTVFPNISAGMAFLVEVVLTTVLLVVILVLNNEKTKSYNLQAPIAVGLTIAILVFAAGNLTGASMNPVRSLYPALFAGGLPMQDLWVYLTAPFVGSIVGALIDRFIMND